MLHRKNVLFGRPTFQAAGRPNTRFSQGNHDGARGAVNYGRRTKERSLSPKDRPIERELIAPLSPRLHALVQGMSQDTGALIQRVYDIVKGGVPDYTLSADPAMAEQLRTSVTLHLGIWYDCLLAARPPTDEILLPVEVAARRRVHQGVTLAGMLRAFRIGSRGFWVGLLEAAGEDAELHNELLFRVSPYLLHHFDVIAQAVSQAYLDEQLQHARWRDRLRLELWSVISARPDDAEAFRRHAEALAIDAWSPHCAAVLRLPAAADSSPRLETAINRLLLRVAERWAVRAESLMHALHRDHLVLWFPVLRGETLVDTDRRLATQLDELAAGCQTVVGAGVGLPGSGAKGWWLSMQQAFRALESSPAGARGGARRYSEILFADVAAASDNVQRYLDAMIERLGAEPQLLETLQAYFELGQHRKAVACKLNIHPNTLDNRLQRIESVLGGRFENVAWLAMLDAALRLRRHGT
jgi:carbohydrate diacid regulator